MSKHKPQPSGTTSARAQLKEQQARAAKAQADRRRLLIIGAVISVALIVVIAVVLVNVLGKQADEGRLDAGGPQQVALGKPLTLGKADAPVTLQVYENAECGHCITLEQKIGTTIDKNVDGGKLKVEYFPMAWVGYEGSMGAANALACAAEGGFLKAYHAGIFAGAKQWTADSLVDLAKDVLPDDREAELLPVFETCVTEGTHINGATKDDSERLDDSWVGSINQASTAAGVTGTPTLFINGAPVNIRAITSAADFQKMIDDAA